MAETVFSFWSRRKKSACSCGAGWNALPALEMFVQRPAQLSEVVAQTKQEVMRLARRAEDFSGHLARRALERRARFCQADKHEPLVVGAARALDVALRFEALEQRRDRRGIEIEARGDILDCHVVAFPQDEHRQILRIGETEPVEERLI